jgi:hypothetical protein
VAGAVQNSACKILSIMGLSPHRFLLLCCPQNLVSKNGREGRKETGNEERKRGRKGGRERGRKE